MKKNLAFVLAVCLAFASAGCGSASSGSASQPASQSASQQSSAASEAAGAAKPTTDPSGATVEIPDQIDTIVSLAPSITETLVALGCGEQLVAVDTNSQGLEGVAEDLPAFDLMQPDMEQLSALQPDVLFVSNMTLYDNSSPYEQLIEQGGCVLCVPSSDSIADIQDDLTFVAAAVGKEQEGEAMVEQMQAEIDRIAAIGETITDKKTVYFEISAAPDMYSFGGGVFLDEMIEIIGAENILGEETGWLRVEPETIMAADPDVILTNVNYIEDPVGEIMGRSGWDALSAVKNQQVYYVDNMASSLPNQNVVKALDQMAKAVYPEYYEG